jgi:hypothetical protein
MQDDFNALKAFDFAESVVHLWIFKRSASQFRFASYYVQTDQELNNLLLGVVRAELNRLTEWACYSHLAETNENSCLAAPIAGSDFEFLRVRVDRPEPDCRIQSFNELMKAGGYVVKFISNRQVVYAVKKSTSNWKTSYLRTHINIMFRNGELSAAEDNRFAIEKYFDFYAFNQTLFIVKKRAFESVMKYRASYEEAFISMQQNADFSSLFTNLQPIIDYVGTNSIQLRRMAQIQERSLFTRPGFLAAVQIVSARRAWELNFDSATNRLIPCDQTAKMIVQVLLDHRLLSEVTDLIYDVPDAMQV